jgi:hypothetical protein
MPQIRDLRGEPRTNNLKKGDLMNLSRKTLNSKLMIPMIAVLLSPVAMARPHTQAKTDLQIVARIAQILEKSGYAYKKAADNVWVVNFKGKSMADIPVFVTSTENLIVMGAVIAPKSSMKVTPDMMFKLLRIVHDIDRVKIGFDDDEDLFLRAEVNAKCFDVEEFKSNMEQVSAGADQVHAAIRSYLVK